MGERSRHSAAKPDSTESMWQSEDGATRDVMVLSLDLVGHTEAIRYDPERARSQMERVRKLVLHGIEAFGGSLWLWGGDSAIGAFWGEHHVDRGALAAIKILQDFQLLKLESDGFEMRADLRIVANRGAIEPQRSEDRLVSVVVNEAANLERHYTRAGELALFDNAYHGLSSRLSRVFYPRPETFHGHVIFSFAGFPNPFDATEPGGIDAKQAGGKILDRTARSAAEPAPGPESMASRLAAVRALASLNLPVAEPKAMARESYPAPDELS